MPGRRRAPGTALPSPARAPPSPSPPLPSRPAQLRRIPPRGRGSRLPPPRPHSPGPAAVPAPRRRRRRAPAAPGRAQERTASRTASRAAAHRPLGGGMHRHRYRIGIASHRHCTAPGSVRASEPATALHRLSTGTDTGSAPALAPAPHRHCYRCTPSEPVLRSTAWHWESLGTARHGTGAPPARHRGPGYSLGPSAAPVCPGWGMPLGYPQDQSPNGGPGLGSPGLGCSPPTLPPAAETPQTSSCTPIPPPTQLHPTASPAPCTPASPHSMRQHRPRAIQSRTRYRHEAPQLITGDSHRRHHASPASFLHEFQSTPGAKNSLARALGRAAPGRCGFSLLFAPKILPRRLRVPPTALPGAQRPSRAARCDRSTMARSSLAARGAGEQPTRCQGVMVPG